MTQTHFLHVDLKFTLTHRSVDPEKVNKHLLTLQVSADEERDPRCLTEPDMKVALTYDAIEQLRKDLATWGPFTVPSNYAAEGQLRTQVEALERQNSALREQTKTLREVRDTQATTIQTLQRQLDENSSAAASRVVELERQLREAEDGQYGELRKLREQVGTLRDQLTASERQVVSLRSELDTQTKRIDAIRRLVPKGHHNPFAFTEELVERHIQRLQDALEDNKQQKLALERRISMFIDERDAATRERDQLKNRLQVSNTSNAHLQKHNDTLVRHLTSLRNLVPVEFRSALATPEEEVGQYFRKLQADRGDAFRERDEMARQWREMVKSRQAEVAKTLTQRVEENLFNGGGALREKLAKAEAKVQKLTERLAKSGLARVDLQRRLEEREEQVKAEVVRGPRTHLALRIVLTHLYNLEKRKYAAAPDSVDIKSLRVGVTAFPSRTPGMEAVAVERFAGFAVFGLGLDGLVNFQIKDLA